MLSGTFGGIFSKRSLTPCEVVQKKIDDNEMWPFSRKFDGRLVYSVRYNRYYVGLISLTVSTVVTIVFFFLQLMNSAYFIWPIVLGFISGFIVVNYRDLRIYELDEIRKRYTFKIGNKVVVRGRYHNIYIRLWYRRDHGRTYYYLILNAFHGDLIPLSDPTNDKIGMRQIGQKIAKNLDLNYFDNDLKSEKHVVRHWKAAD